MALSFPRSLRSIQDIFFPLVFIQGITLASSCLREGWNSKLDLDVSEF